VNAASEHGSGRWRRLVGWTVVCALSVTWAARTLRVFPGSGPVPAGMTRSTGMTADGDFYCRLVVDVPSRPGRDVTLLAGKPGAPVFGIRLHPHGAQARRRLRLVTGLGVVCGRREGNPGPNEVILSRVGGVLYAYVNGTRLAVESTAGQERWEIVVCAPAPVSVRPQKRREEAVADDFARKQLHDGDGWECVAGDWRALWDEEMALSPNRFTCSGTASAGEPALLTTGHAFWNSYSLQVALNVPFGSRAGLVFRYAAPGDYFVCSLSRQEHPARLILSRVSVDGERILAERRLAVADGTWYSLYVDVSEADGVTARVDGMRFLAYSTEEAMFGKVGFVVASGSALFDDMVLRHPPASEDHTSLRLVGGTRSAYTDKEPYDKDGRDQHTARWARNTDAWEAHVTAIGDATWAGRRFHLPLIGDFALRFADVPAGEICLVREWHDGKDCAVTLPAGSCDITRRGKTLCIDGKPLAVGRPQAPLQLACYVPAPSRALSEWQDYARNPIRIARGDEGRDNRAEEILERHLGTGHIAIPNIYSANVREDLFEGAPVGWLRVEGDWRLTSRWQCAKQWAFYGGTGPDDVVQFCKTSFRGDQVHQVYFGMIDLFAREYGNRRYARHDVNISFMTDGVDLFSGYTMLFGGFDNQATFLYRYNQCIARNDAITFPPFVDIDDLHLFWRRLSVEAIDGRIRVLIDDETVFDVRDPDPKSAPSGGHLALWTQANGVVYARLNSVAQHVGRACHPSLTVSSDVPPAPGVWRARRPDRVDVRTEDAGWTRVTNRFGGGDMAALLELPRPVDLRRTPWLELALEIPGDTRVSLHLGIDGKGYIIPLTAPAEQTRRVLGVASDWTPEWRQYVAEPLGVATFLSPADVRGGDIVLRVNLLAQLGNRVPATGPIMLNRLAVGNTSHHGYLMAGLNGNRASAWYRVQEPSFSSGNNGYIQR